MLLTHKINRLPTENEIKLRLDPLDTLRNKEIPTNQENMIIRFNSTYMEIFDANYVFNRCLATFLGLFFLFFSIAMLSFSVYILSSDKSKTTSDFMLLILVVIAFFISLGFGIYGLRYFIFAKTHYPIRFNRKAQCVHFTRLNGTHVTVPWAELFFTPYCDKGVDYLSACIIDPENGKMIERFLLPAESRTPLLHEHGMMFYGPIMAKWRFIVEYMQGDNLALLSKQVYFCYPIDKKRENAYWRFLVCMRMFFTEFRPWYYPIGILIPIMFLPLMFILRTISVYTCRIPTWPAEIEALCEIDHDTSINLSSKTNPKGLKLLRYAIFYLTLPEYKEWLMMLRDSIDMREKED
ncbi:DUF6708 domain-containing protein [Thorsellia anophelis]|uniref:DUF6708 domain-containing protein n=1 Tax=Thorsellia anophelis DSM 18579 TaxID=1123402 RepID=A0A1I0FA51_9GAMM|nr:DUF6708 domain-containing protein [Thorsellia anophelis]SET55079.1 hypothetical protein SAMN02583745_02697 [Thorsellia anophelis DSM 18579]